MSTHAEIAAKLLRDAASFYRAVGGDNAALQEQMSEFARIYENVADLVESDPTGELAGDDGD